MSIELATINVFPELAAASHMIRNDFPLPVGIVNSVDLWLCEYSVMSWRAKVCIGLSCNVGGSVRVSGEGVATL